MNADELLFFDPMPGALPLYEELREIITAYPGVEIKVAKTQITFKARYGFAFMSLRRMKGCPEVFLILTLGLDRRLDSPRVAVATEAYPGRWTHHFILSEPEQLDDELLGWLREAYEFARIKGRKWGSGARVSATVFAAGTVVSRSAAWKKGTTGGDLSDGHADRAGQIPALQGERVSGAWNGDPF